MTITLFNFTNSWRSTAQKMKFFIKHFFSKCDQIRREMKKPLMENFIFSAVGVPWWLKWMLIQRTQQQIQVILSSFTRQIINDKLVVSHAIQSKKKNFFQQKIGLMEHTKRKKSLAEKLAVEGFISFLEYRKSKAILQNNFFCSKMMKELCSQEI